ncbi:DNA polymerase IV [Methylococcaceae bacterium HT4]|nr:DNA polymerase IV [Methylococcaceae bacterium HT4]TXL20608.1 DNA polymerase IV [Methylococcaceae bacterium HT5]
MTGVKPAPLRKIIHIDMDAFFAAVEQRDNPKYQNKPIIVGGAPDSRGVVAACSYEARKYGIHSAMPSSRAFRLCPQAIFVKPRFAIYKEASSAIRQIFYQYTSQVEAVSLDEAYLDVSGSELCEGSASRIAQKIKQQILSETGLVASAGVSYNKFFAKIASDMDKPDGLYLITPDQGQAFVAQLAIGKFHGVGKATERKMHELGIKNGADLKQFSLPVLQQHFGKSALFFYKIAQGIDERPVKTDRESKSIGTETTYAQDLQQSHEIYQQLTELLDKALLKVQAKKLYARTLTVKVKYHDFQQITRSLTFNRPIKNQLPTTPVFRQLLQKDGIGQSRIRLLGITLSSLEKQTNYYRQMDLFD